jgi:hypothetical protein
MTIQISQPTPVRLDDLPFTAEDPTATDRVAGNERLTAMVGVVLLVLFLAEGVTILLGVKASLSLHVFIGVLLIPPVLLKMGTTAYRFARYYLGDPAFVDRGPPMWLLRVAGPLVVLSSVVMLASGVLAVMDPPVAAAEDIHKTSVLVWFGLIAIHVLGHLRETPATAMADWRHGDAVPGRGTRTRAIVGALILGLLLAGWSLTWHLPNLGR